MKAQEFIEAWKEFYPSIQQDGETWEDAWAEKGLIPWTHRVTGEAFGNSDCSPLGKFLLGKLGEHRWIYRTEVKKVDLALARTETWPIPPVCSSNENGWKQHYWPYPHEILIEHDSNCRDSWKEMAKLILLRARLKVLITYTHPKLHKHSDEFTEETRVQFSKMIRHAWGVIKEDNQTEYLLIVGQLEGEGDQSKVNWFYTIYSANGAKTFEDPIPRVASEL